MIYPRKSCHTLSLELVANKFTLNMSVATALINMRTHTHTFFFNTPNLGNVEVTISSRTPTKEREKEYFGIMLGFTMC